jgi:Leucyl-tRNA synthetase
VAAFEEGGSAAVDAANNDAPAFTAAEWKAFSEKEKADVLMHYRIAYQGESTVNWCPALGTVLANDEVKEGYSVRGGHPVYQKKMTQWQLRVSAYAPRLLDALDRLDWTDSLKEMQRNWIGKSQGAEMVFRMECDGQSHDVTIFTTRADTLYGVTFMVLAPESEWVPKLTSAAQKEAVDAYLEQVKKKTERERIAGKAVTGVFSGSYAIHPLTGRKFPCGSPNTSSPATARAPSWPFRPTTAATTPSRRSSTCPSSRSSRGPTCPRRAMTPRKASCATADS